METVDLTHVIRSGMPVFPGDPAPSISPLTDLSRDGFRETALEFGSHTGTHIDAPAHVFPNGKTLGDYPIGKFMGQAVVLHCQNCSGTVGLRDLNSIRREADQADFLLLHTGWGRHWGRPAYLKGYPLLSDDLVQYLVSTGKQGVAIDCISVDAVDSRSLPIHCALLRAGVLPIENLTNLSRLPPGPFRFFALPLSYEGADGAPVRAAALLE